MDFEDWGSALEIKNWKIVKKLQKLWKCNGSILFQCKPFWFCHSIATFVLTLLTDPHAFPQKYFLIDIFDFFRQITTFVINLLLDPKNFHEKKEKLKSLIFSVKSESLIFPSNRNICFDFTYWPEEFSLEKCQNWNLWFFRQIGTFLFNFFTIFNFFISRAEPQSSKSI